MPNEANNTILTKSVKHEMNARKSSGICLNMIVKNETLVLDRLFNSVKDYIDYYVIVDTGSTDGTPEFIKKQMDTYGIPGEVHCREWVNFGTNRQEALQLACAAGKCDWLLILDADEELVCADPGFFSRMEPGVTYHLDKIYRELRYALPNLIDVRQTRWRWVGAVHEYLEVVNGHSPRHRCQEAWIVARGGEGARSIGLTDEEKFLRDAHILEEELRKDPDNCRYRFYLAQSYRDARKFQEAYDNYRVRAEMKGGWDEETSVARHQAGRMAILLGMPHAQVLEELLAAYNSRPARAEPLHELAVHCRVTQRNGEAYLFAKMASLIPRPSDMLFVIDEIYEWRNDDELAIAACNLGKYEEARELCEKLLRFAEEKDAIDCENLQRIEMNLVVAKAGCAAPNLTTW